MKKLFVVTTLIVFTLLLTLNYKTLANTAYLPSNYSNAQASYSNARSRNSDSWKQDKTVELVVNNTIRKATPDEIQNWKNLARSKGLPISSEIMLDFTYVSQKSFVIPNDFCYGHYINFIIPNGVMPPTNKQNCGFFFMKDGSHL